MGWRYIAEQEKSQNQNADYKPFSIHRGLFLKNIYTPSLLRKQVSVIRQRYTLRLDSCLPVPHII
ncbi:MAG: hypothetical protein A2156_02015 [Deltaproteobacteria bacterium RBG_16_48_10]|nr:MAG: hypothetical protein A2156_02015 [Deltaproteobacteria bacterium RBG_16_48_10]